MDAEWQKTFESYYTAGIEDYFLEILLKNKWGFIWRLILRKDG